MLDDNISIDLEAQPLIEEDDVLVFRLALIQYSEE